MNNRTRVAAGTSSREDTPTQQALTGCVLTLLIVWTLAGNFTVCVAVFRFRHLRAKVTNIFIASLALSDLLVAILVMPWKAVAEVVGFWPFGAFCNTWVACDIMCSTASILNLCVISVDRYWAISSPFRYERNMNKKVASVMIGVTWTVSVVISFVPVQFNWHRAEIGELTGHNNVTFHGTSGGVGGNCDTNLSRTYAISTSLISFYIPVAIMIVTYTRIYQIAQVQIRRISSLERAAVRAQSCRSDASEHLSHLCPDLHANPSRPRTHTHPHTQPHRRHTHIHQPHHRALGVSIRKETKVLKTLSIIMGVFVCCWFPFFVLNCALPFCPGPRSRSPYCVSEKTFDIFVWFGWSNSSLNPIIYALNADFRHAFLRLLGCRGGGCLGAGGLSAAMETVVASNEAGYVKQDNSLNAELGVACCNIDARGSEDSGNTVVTLFHPRGTVSEQVTDTEDKADMTTTGTDRRTEIPL